MSTLANSVDSFEMPHNTAFYQVLNCLLRQKQSSEKEIQYHLEVITCYPSIYAMEHTNSIVSKQKKESRVFFD